MAGIKVVRSNRVMALSPVARAVRGRYSWDTGIPSIDDPNSPPVASTPLSLGDIEVGIGSEITSVDILTGVTDADGDTLSVSSVTLATGSATITGTGPWTITPTAEGAGTATAVIVDGRGGSTNRTISWVGTASATAAPTISGVSGTIADGSTITVTGSSLGQAPTLLRIAGDEGAEGTSVATAAGMTVHGSAGNEWLFEAGGTMVVDMQAAAPKTVYKWFDGAAHKDVFLYYERQYFDVGALNPDGNGQIKEVRFAGADVAGEHNDDPALGTVWDVETEKLYRFCGYAGQLNLGGATRAIMTEWSSQIVAGRIIGTDAVGDYEIYADGFTSRHFNDSGAANDTKGWGQIFLPFYRSPDLSTSMRMRNIIALAGRQRFEIRNSANPELANRVVVQYATAASAASATIPLDLTRFTPADGLYLFSVNADGEYSAAHELRAPAAPNVYDPLADDYGVKRLRNDYIEVPDYSAAALAADSLRYQVGFVVDGLDAASAGKPIGICIASSTNHFRGHLRIDHVTGDVVIRAMTNNVGLTLKTASDVHINLGLRRDWEVVVPKTTGELVTLTDMQTDSLIGSAARTSTFDGYYPTRWMYSNTLAAQGALNGRLAYLRCFATTGGVETTLFDFRFTAEQAGLTSVPSAHDSGVVATIGAALTWGAA